MREVAVVGVGMTRFGNSDKTQVEMFAEAAMEAINESNLKPKDIQALMLGNVLGGFEEGQVGMAAYAAAEIGAHYIPAVRLEGICASGALAVRNAVLWVASGAYDIVLAGGTERVTVMGTPFSTRTFAMGSEARYEGPTGITFPGVFALLTHLYAGTYGVPLSRLKEQMAMVAIKNHHNGCFNPKAQFHKEITREDVFKSVMVCDPLQLYDCCPFTDGAAAVVVASGEAARKLIKTPVYIAGTGQTSAGALHTQKDIPRLKARELSAQAAYKEAGLTPKDIDVCELHDCFSIAEIIASEGLGFFEHGKGGEALERGDTRIGGKIPINPSGGLKAKGHPIGATGAAQVYEIAKQLRGECGQRQVEGASTGITDTLGGDGCTICNIILKR